MAANNGWNLMQGPDDQHIPSYAYRNQNPQNTIQLVACRICNRVFLSNQELINHIEDHIQRQEINSRRQHNKLLKSNPIMSNQGQLMFSNTYRPNLGFRPTMVSRREINAFPGGAQQRTVAPALPRIRQIQPQQPPQVASSARNNVVVAPQQIRAVQPAVQQFRQRVMLEELPSYDGTKPYINMMEKPLKKARMDVGDEHNLDLTLKL
ncbi:Zinc finger, C2H [Quillaja saponaria]|uniref:Zinc finger, C2H n=1 Tax=Quillaja saponaria TaxID=32244 RepID=A0AAD7QFE6_QUISA|nr:Zinc finger, C2H [Quillaja saponaria]